MNAQYRILIVEDERLIALDLSRRLPKLGYEVCAIVPTGEEGVAKAAELRPDLVLMDICLRGEMDGIQAAEQINERLGLPVIFLTANSDEMTLSRAKLSHPSSYILKPFKERELQILIDIALQNHVLQGQLRAANDGLEVRVADRTSELARVNEALLKEIEVRKQMESQAREQADLLAKARDAIYVRGLDGTVTYWNHGAELLYGIPECEAIGMVALSLMEVPEEAEAAERETLSRGEWTGELRCRGTRGQRPIVDSRWTLVRDELGRPKTILVVNTDITERKRSEEQFLRTQRLESVGALASGIAHDLNNVFAPIMMATELVGDARDADRAQIIEMLRSSAKRGADMVKQVLMFVRGGSSELHPTAVDHLVHEVRKLMEDTLPCTIHVTSRIERDVGFVLGDQTQLHQVLLNLCVNARDAMPDGGELQLCLDRVTLDPLRSAGLPPGSYVRLTVSDTGTGMTPEVRAKIFEPFFTTKEIGHGTGLGLSTVASIVKKHGGFIDVESELGRGTRFVVYMPAYSAAGCDAVAPRENLPRGSGQLIIMADDDHSVREMTRLALEAHNYRVLVADDGAEALSLFVQHRNSVSLVITDVIMPIMNGRALIHALRKLSPGLPILAFTAAEPSNPLVGTLQDDHASILRKPASQGQLLAAVAQVLASRRHCGAESADHESSEIVTI